PNHGWHPQPRSSPRDRPAFPTRRSSDLEGSARQPLGMPVERFLRDYWQKRPLLIRNAFPGFVSPITPEDLAGLACEEAALSRIRSEEHTSELQSRENLVCRVLLEKHHQQ